jgi:arabinogalactan oligomer/maltooligosaccharide transport system permease protein
MGTFRFNIWFKEFGWRHLVAIFFVIFAIYPILYVLTNSFADFANLTNSKLIPDSLTLKHYKLLSGNPLVPYSDWLYNTYKIAIVAAFFNVFLGTLAAYAFSRLQFKGRRASLLTLVIVQMFPSFLAFVAIYLLFFQISDVVPIMGLGTHFGLILVYLGGSIGFNSWLIKGFMDTISPSLDEAAKVDGASEFQIFSKIIRSTYKTYIVSNICNNVYRNLL